MLLIAKKHQKTEVRRVQIIEAVQKIILKYGSENVTTRMIAGEVGISAGAVYRHFEDKGDIFSFLLDNIGEDLLGEIEPSYIVDGAIIDYLRNIFMNHISGVSRGHGISFQITAAIISRGDKKLNKHLNEIICNYISRIKNLLALGVKTGEIRADIDLDTTALLFYGMMESISNYWMLNNYGFNLEEKTRPMWDIFQKAIVNIEKESREKLLKDNMVSRLEIMEAEKE